MKINYNFINGEHSEIDVSDELGAIILDLRREEENNDRRYRRHNYSLEQGTEDGFDYPHEDEAFNYNRILDIIDTLTEIEQRRLRLLIAGYTFREAAKMDGCSVNAITKAVMSARKKIADALKEE